jgi:Site-specific recombinases, DNA invertase Pin homologs
LSKAYNVAIYIRLSREDGDDMESESITNQRDILLNYVTNNSELTFVDEYIDDGVSGSTFERKNWKRLIEDVDRKKINTIVTKDLSRMGRDYISMGNYIEKEFPEKSIRYIAINDDIDTLHESPGLEYLQFKLMFNDFYIKDGSKKVRRVLKHKKEQGKYTGWKGIYGYKRDPNDKHKLIIDENVKNIVKRMFELAKNGNSPKQIADTFSLENIPTPSIYANLNRGKKSTAYELWCPRTIEELLINPTYIGHLTQGRRKKVSYKSKKEIRVPKEKWIIVKNTHEPIVDENTFYTVEELLKKGKNNPSGNNTYLLKGFLYCKECGHSIGLRRSADKKREYCACNYYTSYSKFKLCTPHSMNYSKLEKSVITEMKNICKKYLDCSDFENKIEEAKIKTDIKIRLKNEMVRIGAKIKQLTNNIDNLYIDKLNEVITLEQYNRLTKKLEDDLKYLNNRKKEQTKMLNNIDSNDNKKDREKTLRLMKEFLTFEKPTRILLVNLISKITISEDKNVEINYKFRVD